jgi:hypothetical protein
MDIVAKMVAVEGAVDIKITRTMEVAMIRVVVAMTTTADRHANSGYYNRGNNGHNQ